MVYTASGTLFGGLLSNRDSVSFRCIKGSLDSPNGITLVNFNVDEKIAEEMVPLRKGYVR